MNGQLSKSLEFETFNPIEFDGIRIQTGLNSFTLTPKQWIEKTRAIGITSQAGRYGGTYAHKDIAFEFASWVSVEFKLYLIKEFQRLKDDENRRLSLAWNLNRTLSKLNYRIHTDAVIPKGLRPPAQGCEGRTTLGHSGEMVINPTGVVVFVVGIGTQPRWGRIMIGRFSQGSSGLATLGFKPESRWDSTAAKIRSRRSTVPPLHPTSFRILPWKGVLAA